MKKIPSNILSQTSTRSNSSGFSLIEVLVALLVLAIGVLGIAALQFKALKYTHDSNIRIQISYLASDIADKMRINRANIGTYVGNHQVDIDDLAANNCDPAAATTAANDLACWRNRVDTLLPHGSNANITVAGNLYTVALSWDDREGETHTIEYSFQ